MSTHRTPDQSTNRRRADIKRVERSVKEIRESENLEKHTERLTHLQNELLESQITKKESRVGGGQLENKKDSSYARARGLQR